jgi:hypothetical protein
MLRSYKSEKGVPFDRKSQTRDYLSGREIPADDQRKYKLRILWSLKDGPLRYGEIKNGLLVGSQGRAEIAQRLQGRSA